MRPNQFDGFSDSGRPLRSAPPCLSFPPSSSSSSSSLDFPRKDGVLCPRLAHQASSGGSPRRRWGRGAAWRGAVGATRWGCGGAWWGLVQAGPRSSPGASRGLVLRPPGGRRGRPTAERPPHPRLPGWLAGKVRGYKGPARRPGILCVCRPTRTDRYPEPWLG